MTVSLTALVTAMSVLVNSAMALVQPPPSAPPKRDRPPTPTQPKRDRANPPATHEYAAGTIVAVDAIAFDPYWRDASLSLADALQPLADIASKPPVNDSLDESKRREAAKSVAKEVKTLRADATKTRRLWMVWVAEPKGKTVSFALSEDRHEIIDDLTVGRLINSEMFAARIDDGFATRLSPLGDADAANATDVKAAAAIIRGRWAPIDVKTVRANLAKEAKRAPIGGFDPPKWHDDAEAAKAVKVEIEESKRATATKNGGSEVTVRFSVPEGQGNVSMITFRMYAKSKDGTRGAQVGGDLIAWGYANRPALIHVPVTTPGESGFDVEIVAARYR